MKRIFLTVPAILVTLFLAAQNYSIKSGEDIKLKKGTADLDIVAADNTGLYFTEARLRSSVFLIGGGGSAHKLFKVDKYFTEVFEKDYKRELKGLDFHSFQSLGNDLYIFATDYERKGKLFKIYGSKIDKTTGDLAGDFTELGSYELESKKDDYEMRMTPLNNGASFLMVSNISGKDRVSIAVSVLDKNFSRKENAIIHLSFEPGHYSLQDVKLTKDNKIVLLGKELEETQVGKKKRKRLVFKQYAMSIYSIRGVKEKSIAMESGERFIINGRLIEQPTGELLLAGFYSNTSKKDDLSGFFINKVDAQKGELTVSSFKAINTGMFGKNFVEEDDDDDESKEEKKELEKRKSKKSDDDEEEELPNEFIIRSVNINPIDNSIVITSEISQYYRYEYTTSTYNSVSKTWNTEWHTLHRFTNKDILVINADKDGNIRWINDIPKNQREQVRTNYSAGYFYVGSDLGNYFSGAGALPYYSSHISMLHDNKLVIIMNDHTSNNDNPSYGDKIKTVYNFRKKSNAYGISIDLATGKMTRKLIAANDEETILMPRHAFVVKNELYMPSWRIRMMAKTKLKFSKIVVK